MNKSLLRLSLFGCVTFMSTVTSEYATQAQEGGEAAVSIANGIDQITEGRVTGTISFLASDELAGRGTGTPEFNIAAAYVASRFRGAGLTGGATDGSFYHETDKRQIQTPSTAFVYQNSQAQALPHLGLLSGGKEQFTASGTVNVVDLSGELPDSGLTGIVGGVYVGDARGPRLAAQIARIAAKLESAGATALLLGISAENDLVRTAQLWKDKARAEPSQNRFSIPVLLVPKESIGSADVRLDIPANIVTNAPMRNVIGMIPGSDPAQASEAILFSAHLDHLGVRPVEGDNIYNGADDDASGVTAVVMLADAFAAMPKPRRTILFMTFWGEESGLLGSKQFASTPSWPLDKIVANVNIEMIGRPEPGARGKIWMTGWNESNLGLLMNQASSQQGVEIFEHPKHSAPLYRASDNWSFVEKGVIAHSFSAGSLHPDYHQPDDEWDRLEIPHMTQVIKGLFYATQPLAQGEVTPAKSR